jgi:hypothetical protein
MKDQAILAELGMVEGACVRRRLDPEAEPHDNAAATGKRDSPEGTPNALQCAAR